MFRLSSLCCLVKVFKSGQLLCLELGKEVVNCRKYRQIYLQTLNLLTETTEVFYMFCFSVSLFLFFSSQRGWLKHNTNTYIIHDNMRFESKTRPGVCIDCCIFRGGGN